MDKSLAPGFARITYGGASGTHHCIIPVNLAPGWISGSEPSLIDKSTDSTPAETAIGFFVEAWRELLCDDQNIGLCEIYSVNATTGEGTFVYGFDLNTAGIRAGNSVLYRGVSITYKLSNGRLARIVVMENDYTQDLNDLAPFADGLPEAVLTDYLTGVNSIYYGRGNAYPFAALRMTSKEYDVLRKRGGF